MSWARGLLARASFETDITFTGTVEILAAPGATKYYIIRSLLLSSDTNFNAACKSGATRKGPKIWGAAQGGVALSDMEIQLTYNEAFNITFVGGGLGSVYVEYEVAGS